MNLGQALGYAQSGQFDQQINDTRYRQQALRNQEEMNAAKRKLFMSDIEFVEGGNQFDSPLVKEEVKKRIHELGNYVAQNPDFESNVEKSAYVRQLKKNIKDNPTVLRALTTNDNRKALYDYAQESKNKAGMFDEQELNNQLIRASNYERWGNPDGEEAAMKEGFKPYLFTRPQDFRDTNKDFSEMGNSFKDMRVKHIKGGMGAYEEYSNPETLKYIANQYYQNNKRQIDQTVTSKGIDPIGYIMKGIDAHVTKKRDMGDYGLQKSMALERYKSNLASKGPVMANTYQMSVRGQDVSMVPVKALNAIVGDDARTIIKSKDGKITDVTGLFKTRNTGYNFRADNKGTRLAESIGYMPIEQAVEMGIIDPGFGWFSDDEVAPNFADYAEIVTSTDDKGNTQKAVKIKAFKMFDENNPANEGIFNSETMTSKQQPLPTDMYSAQTINIGGHEVMVGSRITNNKTGKSGILQADGTIK